MKSPSVKQHTSCRGATSPTGPPEYPGWEHIDAFTRLPILSLYISKQIGRLGGRGAVPDKSGERTQGGKGVGGIPEWGKN